jgi:hypothetical protein
MRRQANSYNVAGLLEGSDPALKAEAIVFSSPKPLKLEPEAKARGAE